MIADLIIIALCLIAVAGVIGLALQTGQRRGWMSARGLAAIVLAVLVVALAVWALVVTFDTPADASQPAGVAGNAGPTVGVASNGNCDPACLMAVLGRTAGTLL